MSGYTGRRGPTDEEKAELRRLSDVLVRYGYRADDARKLLWDVYQGGMRAVVACMSLHDELPSIGGDDIVFGEGASGQPPHG